MTGYMSKPKRIAKCAEDLSEVQQILEDIASMFSDLKNEIESESENTENNEEQQESVESKIQQLMNDEKIMDSLNKAEELVNTVMSERDELQSEYENWRDGLQGTNLEGSNTYSMLDETIDYLEGIEISFDVPEIPTELDDIDTFVSDLENLASDIESASQEFDNIEPPMPFRG